MKLYIKAKNGKKSKALLISSHVHTSPSLLLYLSLSYTYIYICVYIICVNLGIVLLPEFDSPISYKSAAFNESFCLRLFKRFSALAIRPPRPQNFKKMAAKGGRISFTGIFILKVTYIVRGHPYQMICIPEMFFFNFLFIL